MPGHYLLQCCNKRWNFHSQMELLEEAQLFKLDSTYDFEQTRQSDKERLFIYTIYSMCGLKSSEDALRFVSLFLDELQSDHSVCFRCVDPFATLKLWIGLAVDWEIFIFISLATISRIRHWHNRSKLLIKIFRNVQVLKHFTLQVSGFYFKYK